MRVTYVGKFVECFRMKDALISKNAATVYAFFLSCQQYNQPLAKVGGRSNATCGIQIDVVELIPKSEEQ